MNNIERRAEAMRIVRELVEVAGEYVAQAWIWERTPMPIGLPSDEQLAEGRRMIEAAKKPRMQPPLYSGDFAEIVSNSGYVGKLVRVDYVDMAGSRALVDIGPLRDEDEERLVWIPCDDLKRSE